MPISDNYDKLRNRDNKVFVYQHYPRWVKDSAGVAVVVKDEYEHEVVAPKDYKDDPYLEERRRDQEESRANVLEIKTRPTPTIVPALAPKAKSIKEPQKLDPKPVAVKTGNTLINDDSHS